MAREKNNAVQAVDERAKALADAQAEAQRVADESVPTPTQRENDLAKVGALDIDSKEESSVARQASAEPTGTAYRNRAAKSE